MNSGIPTITCPCTERHHLHAVYYVSVVRDTAAGPSSDYRLLAGPFSTHQEALAWVDRAKAVAATLDPKAHWYGYGTVAMAPGYQKPGILNESLGMAA